VACAENLKDATVIYDAECVHRGQAERQIQTAEYIWELTATGTHPVLVVNGIQGLTTDKAFFVDGFRPDLHRRYEPSARPLFCIEGSSTGTRRRSTTSPPSLESGSSSVRISIFYSQAKIVTDFLTMTVEIYASLAVRTKLHHLLIESEKLKEVDYSREQAAQVLGFKGL
jgi:hypothetical protein